MRWQSTWHAMDPNMLLAWHKYGGGKELVEKLYKSIGADVVSFPYGPMPTQPLGGYKNSDQQGGRLLKFRTIGLRTADTSTKNRASSRLSERRRSTRRRANAAWGGDLQT